MKINHGVIVFALGCSIFVLKMGFPAYSIVGIGGHKKDSSHGVIMAP